MTKNTIPVGTQFGQLTVLARLDRKSGRNYYYRCRCSCKSNREIEVQGTHLLHSGQKSCGCLRLTHTHKADPSQRRLRTAWYHMINRCSKPNDKDYRNYGGRGITICAEWLHDFNAFKDWALANGHQEGLSLDRIDNDGNYTPDNCRWATNAQQSRNTRRVRRITAFGETKTLSEWAEDPRCQVSYSILHQRITTLGWDFEAALLIGKHERPRLKAA